MHAFVCDLALCFNFSIPYLLTHADEDLNQAPIRAWRLGAGWVIYQGLGLISEAMANRSTAYEQARSVYLALLDGYVLVP